jgi:hypothetical protein
MDAGTCTYMCAYEMLGLSALTPVLIHERHPRSTHVGVSIFKPLFGIKTVVALTEEGIIKKCYNYIHIMHYEECCNRRITEQKRLNMILCFILQTK